MFNHQEAPIQRGVILKIFTVSDLMILIHSQNDIVDGTANSSHMAGFSAKGSYTFHNSSDYS